jgi:RND family efflux transporter MFP subunit
MGKLKVNLKINCFVLFSFLALFLSSCSLLSKEDTVLKPPLVKPAKQNFAVEVVKKGTISQQIKNQAVFVSKQKQQLFFKQSGSRLQSIDVKMGDTVVKGQEVAHLDPEDMEDQVYMQKLMLEKAKLYYQQAKQSSAYDGLTLQLKKMDVDSAQNELTRLQAALEETKLISQIDGVVTYLASANPGDYINPFSLLVSISDPKQLQIEAVFDTPSDLIPVKVGAKVDVTFNQKVYKGHVVQAPSSAPYTNNEAQQDRDGKTIVIDLVNMPDYVTTGDSANIVITTEQRDNTIIIPKDALSSFMGRDFVHVLSGEARTEVDVEKGISSVTEIEITKGLKEGQKVIINNN